MIKTINEEIKQGTTYSGKSCVSCGSPVRYARTKKCVNCSSLSSRRHRQRPSSRKRRRDIYADDGGRRREYNSRWKRENKDSRAFHEANRRSRKKQAVVKWANVKKIREIYRNCPEGYHVDHIVPLKGVDEKGNHIICGLHVENNLQYLTAEENISKGNRFS